MTVLAGPRLLLRLVNKVPIPHPLRLHAIAVVAAPAGLRSRIAFKDVSIGVVGDVPVNAGSDRVCIDERPDPVIAVYVMTDRAVEPAAGIERLVMEMRNGILGYVVQVVREYMAVGVAL
ncbi:MAG: hypothetical protein C5S49_04470 [Candidatus Methanogaster sp.]|nr:MAG: hypothetical protein C5S49_04470 [ANME-2 cluster archaeon]